MAIFCTLKIDSNAFKTVFINYKTKIKKHLCEKELVFHLYIQNLQYEKLTKKVAANDHWRLASNLTLVDTMKQRLEGFLFSKPCEHYGNLGKFCDFCYNTVNSVPDITCFEIHGCGTLL